MLARSLKIGILLVATIVLHDAWMATSGHDMGLAGPVSTCEPVEHPGQHRHHGGDDEEAESSAAMPLALAGMCSELRTVAPLNREMGPALADVPIALMSDSTISMLFAATSRTVVESPPPHPPNLSRAFFQVYRI